MANPHNCLGCDTPLSRNRIDAIFHSRSCGIAWKRANPDKVARVEAEKKRRRSKVRKATRYRVFEVFFAGQQMRPVGEVEAFKKSAAIAQCSNGGDGYVAVPVGALKEHSADGKPKPV